MEDLITVTEAAAILDVSISTVSYYIRSGKLVGVDSNQRTAHKKTRKLVNRKDVIELKEKQDAKR